MSLLRQPRWRAGAHDRCRWIAVVVEADCVTKLVQQDSPEIILTTAGIPPRRGPVPVLINRGGAGRYTRITGPLEMPPEKYHRRRINQTIRIGQERSAEVTTG